MSNSFTDELTAEVGHNSGVDPAELVADEIASVLLQYKDRRDALVSAAATRKVTDNDSIGRAADTQTLIRTLRDAIWARAKEVAQPYTNAVETAKTRTQRFVVDLEQADADLTQKVDDCRAEQRRRATLQREEQRRQEQALRPPVEEEVSPQIDSGPAPRRRADPLPPVEGAVSLPAVRGDYGTRVGDRTVTTYVYKDPRKLPLDVLNAPAVAKAIQASLRTYAKLHPVIKHVTVETDMATTTRRPN